MAALYARSAGVVRGRVCSEVTASEAVIDDACQFAWVRLLHHGHRVGRDRAVSWLITTALHEVFKLVRRDGHDLSLEQLMEETGDLRINRTAPAPQEVVGARLRLELLRELPERQERLMWLRGLGFGYPEMAVETDMTFRTIDRQLTRARRNIRLVEARGGTG
ncbi:MAG TPA: sigma factor-like helix-turn-helix DNA-binding protein [Solirubrobacteraceae bacterium]|nr:sigma factor-like helix-turn-helix DNA-binding protein [Solirubrobacteraceae bacterium]